MAEAGEAPEEDFAAYSTSLMETSQKMADTAELGNPVCSALVLKGGRMLLMHEASIEGQSVYLSILCGGVPAGVQSLIGKIVVCVSNALTGNRYQEQ